MSDIVDAKYVVPGGHQLIWADTIALTVFTAINVFLFLPMFLIGLGGIAVFLEGLLIPAAGLFWTAGRIVDFILARRVR